MTEFSVSVTYKSTTLLFQIPFHELHVLLNYSKGPNQMRYYMAKFKFIFVYLNIQCVSEI